MRPAKLIEKAVSIKDETLSVSGERFTLHPGRRIWVIGSGKAAAPMAAALEQRLGNRIADGIVLCAVSTSQKLKRIQQFETTHPLPSDGNIAATMELLSFVKGIPSGDIVFYLLSGGSSAMLCLPGGDLELEDLTITGKLLLESGADIHEMNVVRKHLSAVKGGQLLGHMAGRTVIDLVLSDVPGDSLEAIGSGPTTPDSSTFSQARSILTARNLWDKIPAAVRDHIEKGCSGEISETPKPGSISEQGHFQFILGSAGVLAKRVAAELTNAGYNCLVDDAAYSGDVKAMARKMAGDAISILSRNDPVAKPAARVYFGESTVNVTGNGKGGRNQELALATCLAVEGQHHITMLSAGTDGRDGPTDAAGAISTANTALLARKQGIQPETHLSDNDSYRFFSVLGDLLITGPTGNNLMDLQIVLID